MCSQVRVGPASLALHLVGISTSCIFSKNGEVKIVQSILDHRICISLLGGRASLETDNEPLVKGLKVTAYILMTLL